MSDYYLTDGGELYHYGVLGMKWGKRKAQRYESKARTYRGYAKNNLEDAKYDRKDASKAAKAGDHKYAKSLNESANYSTKLAKDWNAKADKYSQKAKDINQKHIDRAGKQTYDRVSKQKLGKTYVQSIVLGTYGALKYNQARARGASRGEAAVNAILYDTANAASLGVLSVAEPRLAANDRRRRRR